MEQEKLLERVFDKNPIILMNGWSLLEIEVQTVLLKKSYKKLHRTKDLAVIDMETEIISEYHKMKPAASKKLLAMQKAGKKHSFAIEVMLWTQKILFEYDTDCPVVITGSPRSEDEARALLSFSETLHKQLYVFNIKTEKSTDTRAEIEKYDNMVNPALRVLSGKQVHILNVEINSKTTHQSVHDKLLKHIGNVR